MLNLHTQSVNVSRTELLKALRANLEAHQDEYREAMTDYQAKVIAELTASLERAKAGDFSKVEVRIPQPESHKQDFLDVIEMMELSVDETINLDSSAFKAYFRNEWPWKRQFELMAASYKA